MKTKIDFKRGIAMLICVLGLGLNINAQQHKDGGKHMEQMQAELKLTDAQVGQIKAIRKETKTQLEANKSKFIADKKALHEANHLAKKTSKEKIDNLLTPEQKIKWDQLKEQKRTEKMSQRQAEISTKLGLNADQQNAFKAAHLKRENQMKIYRTKYASDEKSLMEKRKEVNKQFVDDLKSFLTKEQMNQFKELKHQPKQ